MLVFHLNINMQLIIFHIETHSWNNPSITSIMEKILMEITDTVGVRLVYLAEALIFDSLLNCLTIDFGIKCQFNGVDDIFIELLKSDFTSISFYSLFDMFIYIFIRDEPEIVLMSHISIVKFSMGIIFRAYQQSTRPFVVRDVS